MNTKVNLLFFAINQTIHKDYIAITDKINVFTQK